MSDKKEKYTELDVEKLNIVDSNGIVKLTLFNQENIPPAIMDGKDILPGHRQSDPISGIMFYNSEGDECGGLIYGNEKDKDGNKGIELEFNNNTVIIGTQNPDKLKKAMDLAESNK